MARSLTLRFHTPLIELDGRIYRIRPSDKYSRLRPRKVSRAVAQADEAEFVMQPRVEESCRSATLQLVLPSKPLAGPMPRGAVNLCGSSAITVDRLCLSNPRTGPR